MLRATALVTVAALALHELRYLIGYGGGTPEALSSQGHGYLPVAGALADALLVVAAAARRARPPLPRLRPRPRLQRPRSEPVRLLAGVLALNLAGRAPPSRL